MSICVGSMVRKKARESWRPPISDCWAREREGNPLEPGLIVGGSDRGWWVLWSDGSIYAERDQDLTVIEQEAP